jgi:hypothetical protein
MLSSLPFGLVEHVLSFSDEEMKSAVMCASRELRDAVSATMALSQAIVFTRLPRRPYRRASDPAPEQQYGQTLQQWLHHYPHTLTSLSLRECQFLTDKDYKLLADRFPLLTHLDVSGCRHVSSIGAKKFVQGCKSLTNFRCIFACRSKDLKVTPAYIKILARSTSMKVLSLALGSKNKSGALAPLHLHPALAELNLCFLGFGFVSLGDPSIITLPSLRTLRLYRGEWSVYSWRAFFLQALPSLPTLPRLPSLEFLHLDAAKTLLHNIPGHVLPDCALTELLSARVRLALATSKLSSIVMSGIVSPSRMLQLQQWTTLGPRNILGQLISLSFGEPWFKK